jgi:hypothetical protein
VLPCWRKTALGEIEVISPIQDQTRQPLADKESLILTLKYFQVLYYFENIIWHVSRSVRW